jgi:hypothetical protein
MPNVEKVTIFVSHVTKDKEKFGICDICCKLKKKINEKLSNDNRLFAKCDFYIAGENDNLLFGELHKDIKDELKDKVLKSEVFLAMLSNDYSKRVWCGFEALNLDVSKCSRKVIRARLERIDKEVLDEINSMLPKTLDHKINFENYSEEEKLNNIELLAHAIYLYLRNFVLIHHFDIDVPSSPLPKVYIAYCPQKSKVRTYYNRYIKVLENFQKDEKIELITPGADFEKRVDQNESYKIRLEKEIDFYVQVINSNNDFVDVERDQLDSFIHQEKQPTRLICMPSIEEVDDQTELIDMVSDKFRGETNSRVILEKIVKELKYLINSKIEYRDVFIDFSNSIENCKTAFTEIKSIIEEDFKGTYYRRSIKYNRTFAKKSKAVIYIYGTKEHQDKITTEWENATKHWSKGGLVYAFADTEDLPKIEEPAVGNFKNEQNFKEINCFKILEEDSSQHKKQKKKDLSDSMSYLFSDIK